MSVPTRSIRAFVGALAALALALLGLLAGPASATDGTLSRSLVDDVESRPYAGVPVVVQARSTDAAAYAVRLLRGTVHARLPLIQGVTATVPGAFLPILVRMPGIEVVTADGGLRSANLPEDEATTTVGREVTGAPIAETATEPAATPAPTEEPSPAGAAVPAAPGTADHTSGGGVAPEASASEPVPSQPAAEPQPAPAPAPATEPAPPPAPESTATATEPAPAPAAESASEVPVLTDATARPEDAPVPAPDAPVTEAEAPAPETSAAPLPGANGPAVAIVDSGVADHPDLVGRVTHVAIAAGTGDGFGHGTHVAGIVAANGPHPGVAPGARIVDVRVTDALGRTSTGTVLRGLQWIADHAGEHGIRVVNISLSSVIGQSARIDPIVAAVEALWSRGIVVVAAAGNRGGNAHAVDFAPANAPRAITVGASGPHGAAGFSSVGTTHEGRPKPELLAPGVSVLSLLAGPTATLAASHPEAVEEGAYFRMSGTSMSAPVVAGAAAVLLEARPWLTPDQVKAALVSAGTLDPTGATARLLHLPGALALDTSLGDNPPLGPAPAGSSYADLRDDLIAQLYAEWLGYPIPAATWTSATWTSATWTSATWTSATWTSATWTR